MTERIDTKAVLADCLPPNPANYKSNLQCLAVAIVRLGEVRAALAQEIADRGSTAEKLRDYATGLQLDADRGRIANSGQLHAIGAWMQRLAAALAEEKNDATE